MVSAYTGQLLVNICTWTREGFAVSKGLRHWGLQHDCVYDTIVCQQYTFTHDFICSPNSRHGLIHVVKFEFYRAIQSHGKVCGGWGGSEDAWVWNIFPNWVLHLK